MNNYFLYSLHMGGKKVKTKNTVPNKASENIQNQYWNDQLWLNTEILVASIYDFCY